MRETGKQLEQMVPAVKAKKMSQDKRKDQI